MKYLPHAYQRYAIDFIKQHPQSVLMLDCGLGKTSVTLQAINELGIRNVLVIAPIRVCDVWLEEIEKWVAGLRWRP